MKYMNRDDFTQAVEIVLGRSLDVSERNRLEDAEKWVDDPRRGYQIIDSIESLGFWLQNGRYTVCHFIGGLGLLMTDGGGCWGYLSESVAEQWEKGWRPIYKLTNALSQEPK